MFMRFFVLYLLCVTLVSVAIGFIFGIAAESAFVGSFASLTTGMTLLAIYLVFRLGIWLFTGR
jgi:hypothetical protein